MDDLPAADEREFSTDEVAAAFLAGTPPAPPPTERGSGAGWTDGADGADRGQLR